jgi:hypothetical protein
MPLKTPGRHQMIAVVVWPWVQRWGRAAAAETKPTRLRLPSQELPCQNVTVLIWRAMLKEEVDIVEPCVAEAMVHTLPRCAWCHRQHGPMGGQKGWGGTCLLRNKGSTPNFIKSLNESENRSRKGWDMSPCKNHHSSYRRKLECLDQEDKWTGWSNASVGARRLAAANQELMEALGRTLDSVTPRVMISLITIISILIMHQTPLVNKILIKLKEFLNLFHSNLQDQVKEVLVWNFKLHSWVKLSSRCKWEYITQISSKSKIKRRNSIKLYWTSW